MEGGCFCGAIRYVIDDNDYGSGNCHCTMCRRTSGAAASRACSRTSRRALRAARRDRESGESCHATTSPLAAVARNPETMSVSMGWAGFLPPRSSGSASVAGVLERELRLPWAWENSFLLYPSSPALTSRTGTPAADGQGHRGA